MNVFVRYLISALFNIEEWFAIQVFLRTMKASTSLHTMLSAMHLSCSFLCIVQGSFFQAIIISEEARLPRFCCYQC